MALSVINYITSFGSWFLATPEPKPGLQEVQPQRSALFAPLFAKGPVLPQVDASPISGMARGSIFVVSDITSIYRSAQDLASNIFSFSPKGSMEWMRGVISGKDLAIGYHAFGSITGVNTILGCAGIAGAIQGHAYAKAVGDPTGELLGKISGVKGASLMGAGITYGAFRPLAIAAKLANHQIAPTLGHLAGSVAGAGAVCYSLYFGTMVAELGIHLSEGVRIQKRLEKATTLEEKLDVLQKILVVDPSKIKASDKQLIQEALVEGKKRLCLVLKELGIGEVSEGKLLEILYRVLGEGFSGPDKESLIKQELVKIGLSMKVIKRQRKLEAKMGRVLGREGIAALKELGTEGGLLNRIQMADCEAIKKGKIIAQKVEASLKGKMREHGGLAALCLLGVISMTMGVVITSGAALIAAAAFMLALCVLMAGVDGYYLYQSYLEERPGVHDKKVVMISTAIGAVSLLGMIGLALSGVVTMGVFPLVVSLVLSSIWMIQNGVTLGVIHRNEKRYLEKYPTLEGYIRALEKNAGDDSLKKMFANLSVDIKQKIQLALLGQNVSRLEAARFAQESCEKERGDELELLRDSITKYFVN